MYKWQIKSSRWLKDDWTALKRSHVVSLNILFRWASPVSLVLICFCFWLQALINILKQKEADGDPESVIRYLKPFRIIISLLDKPEIGRDLWAVLQRLVEKLIFQTGFTHEIVSAQVRLSWAVCCWRWSELFTVTVWRYSRRKILSAQGSLATSFLGENKC